MTRHTIIGLAVALFAAFGVACDSGEDETVTRPGAGSTTPSLPQTTDDTTGANRVLFVGNSFTFWNSGLARHYAELAASSESPVAVDADAEVLPGAWLEVMWDRSEAPSMIADGDYDTVVLQDDLPETDIATFHEYARRFVDHARAHGVQPVLFMAWPYERLGWITLDEIAQAHQEIADELGVAVAPVGLAWQRSMGERPDLSMYDSDAEHPSIHGTYLAVSVVYATIQGESPEGFKYRPERVSDAEAEFLQRIAWETVNQYKAP